MSSIVLGYLNIICLKLTVLSLQSTYLHMMSYCTCAESAAATAAPLAASTTSWNRGTVAAAVQHTAALRSTWYLILNVPFA
jgi:hypothetical protein